MPGSAEQLKNHHSKNARQLRALFKNKRHCAERPHCTWAKASPATNAPSDAQPGKICHLLHIIGGAQSKPASTVQHSSELSMESAE